MFHTQQFTIALDTRPTASSGLTDNAVPALHNRIFISIPLAELQIPLGRG